MPVEDQPEQEKAKMNAAAGTGKKRGPGLAPDIQARIGRKLTAAYDDVLQQPVPDRFLLLLDELDAKMAEEPKGKAKGQ